MVLSLTWKDIEQRIQYAFLETDLQGKKIYGVPRGGLFVATIMKYKFGFEVVDDPSEADVIVDDLVDSGKTRAGYTTKYPEKEFITLYNKTENYSGIWINFPWEEEASKDIEDSVVRIIEYLGQDINSKGLIETPKRVVKSWGDLYSGYEQDPSEIMKWFDDDSDEMVVARDIDFYSTCEHHMLPFFGKAYVAYIPNGKVLGISKIARLVDCFSRRLQIQERITRQIGEAIESGDVIGLGVVLKGQHLCMMSRGVNKQGADIVTSYVSGAMREKPEAREEFMRFID